MRRKFEWELEEMSEALMNAHVNKLDFKEKEGFFKNVQAQDRTSFLICGMTKDQYELMLLNREIDMLVFFRDYIESGERSSSCKAVKEMCIQLDKEAEKKRNAESFLRLISANKK